MDDRWLDRPFFARTATALATAAILTVAALVPAAASAAAEPVVLASDTMARSTTSGWGSAGVGGAVPLTSTAISRIDGARASLRNPGPGRSATSTLLGVRGLSVDSTVDVAVAAAPKSGAVYVGHTVRATATAPIWRAWSCGRAVRRRSRSCGSKNFTAVNLTSGYPGAERRRCRGPGEARGHGNEPRRPSSQGLGGRIDRALGVVQRRE